MSWLELSSYWHEIQTPGGIGTSTNGQVLYNSLGTVAGDPGLTFEAATDTLTSGRVLVGDGTNALPGMAFASEPGTGFMRASQNNIRFRMDGTDFLGLNSWGLFLAGDNYSLSGGGADDWGIGRYAAGVGKALAGPNPATNGSWAAVHYIGIGTAPTVTGDGTTNGSVVGSDFASRITVGTGTTTTITLTFGTAFTNAPACVVNAATTTTPINVSTTVSAATLTTTAFTAGEVLHVMCGGF